jgi:hypothetical protein
MSIGSPTLASSSQEPRKLEQRKRSSARRWAWSLIGVGALGLAFVVVAVVVTPTSTSSPPPVTVPASALGTFAGYNASGPVRTIAAEWRVPKITLLNSSASATWIGVQSPSGGFVQIGITEYSNPQLDILNGDSAVDQGFWSDDTVGFSPQPLDDTATLDQHVRAGDLISASIAEVRGGWRLSLRDARSGLSFDQTIPMTTGDFNQAEWSQEDPTNNANEPLPYPRLGAVVFTHLSVNGHQPVLGLQNAVWMSLPHRDFGVTELRDDSFAVVPVTFDQTQAQFLSAGAPYADAARRFDNIEGTWRAHPPTSAAALKTLAPFEAAERQYDQTLVNQQWTGVSPAEITTLVKCNRLDMAALLALARTEPRPGAAVLAQLAAARAAKGTANYAIDVALRLPG